MLRALKLTEVLRCDEEIVVNSILKYIYKEKNTVQRGFRTRRPPIRMRESLAHTAARTRNTVQKSKLEIRAQTPPVDELPN